MVNEKKYLSLNKELQLQEIVLVAVSKTKSVSEIMALYQLGHRDFGENYVQELVEKKQQLPQDIRWHFIGHLQSNKVKYIAPFISLIHSVDSIKLLKEINKQGFKINRCLDVLLQVHIAQEETKFGWSAVEVETLLNSNQISTEDWKNIKITGFMGMASDSGNPNQVIQEFQFLKSLFDKYIKLSFSNFQLKVLSMGMSNDYNLAIRAGSNMVRIGSLIFGERKSV